MRQIRQYHGTRLRVVCLTYIYLRDQRDKSFSYYKIEDKMNKEFRSELETQGHILETTRADMEAFKGSKSDTGVGEQSFNMVCFHFGITGLHKGGNKCSQWKDLSQDEAREKGLRFVTGTLQAAN
jgi:hypothetical protein